MGPATGVLTDRQQAERTLEESLALPAAAHERSLRSAELALVLQ